jgi:predicted lactoylglutathione lyase
MFLSGIDLQTKSKEVIIMQQRISIITLGVKEIELSKQFYNSLGWKLASKQDEGIVVYNLNQMALALYPVDKLAEDAPVELQLQGFPKCALAYNVNSESEVDSVLAEAERAGARIIKSAQKVFWGGYSGYFSDPDNFLWEVAYNPFITLGSNGEFQWGNSDGV